MSSVDIHNQYNLQKDLPEMVAVVINSDHAMYV